MLSCPSRRAVRYGVEPAPAPVSDGRDFFFSPIVRRGRILLLVGDAQRFWSHVAKKEGCWEWTAAKKNGYGVFARKVPGTVIMKGVYAHRHSWEMKSGPIPKGLCVLHKCDNRPCVRNDHLFLGTKRDNTADMMSKGRGKQPGLKGSSQPNSKLTKADVLAIRSSSASQTEEAKKYGVSQGLISRIRLRRAWKHV